MQSDFWIMRPFNGLFLAVFAAFLLLLIVSSLLLRKKPERTKRIVLIAACVATTIGFVVYKYFLSLDRDFNVLTAEMGGFNWWGELPLQLCNINMILIPVGVLTKKRPLMSFSFFLGPLGAAMALMMPGVGFENCSILLPRMIGYYFTHFMVFFGALALWGFGIYKPTFRDILPALISTIILNLVIFLINLGFRRLGLNPFSNYFYNVETEGNPVLELFHSWLPYPFAFTIPSLGILIPYMLIVTGLFQIGSRGKKK